MDEDVEEVDMVFNKYFYIFIKIWIRFLIEGFFLFKYINFKI